MPFYPTGSKYPIFKDSGPKNHTHNGLWDQSPSIWSTDTPLGMACGCARCCRNSGLVPLVTLVWCLLIDFEAVWGYLAACRGSDIEGTASGCTIHEKSRRKTIITTFQEEEA